MRLVSRLLPIRLAILCLFSGLLTTTVRPSTPTRGLDLSVPGRANATASIAADDRTVAVAWGASLPGGATDIYLATSVDVAALDGTPQVVTGGVCYCCKTAIAAGAGGEIYAAWRHAYPGNIRDIAFTQSRDGGRTFAAPIRVSEDKWVLEGCPDDGPAMAVDAANIVHVVWPTLVNEQGAETTALFYATSSDGRAFSPRQRIPTRGMPHHPQISVIHVEVRR